MNMQQALQSGDLNNAMMLCKEKVKNHPSEKSSRAFLAELCRINGELEKADKHLQSLLMLSPESAISIGTWRQLIRAAHCREAVYVDGAVPTLLDEPTPAIKASLNALIGIREKDSGLVNKALDKIRSTNGTRDIYINDNVVSDFVDLDETSGRVLEFLGSNGKYFWIDLEQIERVEFDRPARPLDLLWRKCAITLRNGSEGVVFMPTIYPMSLDDMQEKLGRATQWHEKLGCQVGSGLREFLVDEDVLTVMDLKVIAVK